MNQTKSELEGIVDRSIERHGGSAAFAALAAIQIKFRRLGGAIPRAKGIGRTFPHPGEATIQPRAKIAVFHGLADDGGDVTFDNGTMTVNGKKMDHYRQTFNGLRKIRRWSCIDAAYFFGYALSDYFGYPFTLPDLTTCGVGRRRDGWTWIEKNFPDKADTHSQQQRFWFDESGLLRRHDYRADIIGPIFYGAHFSREYRFDLPIPIAERRTVKIRFGKFSTPVTVLDALLEVQGITSV